jgi:hypothetical protein
MPLLQFTLQLAGECHSVEAGFARTCAPDKWTASVTHLANVPPTPEACELLRRQLQWQR